MHELVRKRDLIHNSEVRFANAIGGTVFEKPRVSYWMVLIPFLFFYFFYRMQKYKKGREKFDQDFMITRLRTLDEAVEALDKRRPPDIQALVRRSGLAEALRKPYAAWVEALALHYTDLLKAGGETFEHLVRGAYRNRGNYLLALNRLSQVEAQLYAALRPAIEAQPDTAADIIATIEKTSQRLRREAAERIFP
jgi:hypothetical protein